MARRLLNLIAAAQPADILGAVQARIPMATVEKQPLARQHVERVHISLIQIEAPNAAGEFKSVCEGSAALGWRHEPEEMRRNFVVSNA